MSSSLFILLRLFISLRLFTTGPSVPIQIYDNLSFVLAQRIVVYTVCILLRTLNPTQQLLQRVLIAIKLRRPPPPSKFPRTRLFQPSPSVFTGLSLPYSFAPRLLLPNTFCFQVRAVGIQQPLPTNSIAPQQLPHSASSGSARISHH